MFDLSCNEVAKWIKSNLFFKINFIKKFEESPSSIKKDLADPFKIPESALKGIKKMKQLIIAVEWKGRNKSLKRGWIQGG